MYPAEEDKLRLELGQLVRSHDRLELRVRRNQLGNIIRQILLLVAVVMLGMLWLDGVGAGQ